MAVLIELTALFALRCGEACSLMAEDFCLQAEPPYLKVGKRPGAPRARKSPGDVPISDEQVARIHELQTAGVTQTRHKRNRYAQWEVQDHYIMPKHGLLFPSERQARTEMPITYHAVWSAISRLAIKFDKLYPENGFKDIRTHSGRATAITLMMGQGLPMPITMTYARIICG